jgi:hypothetical protein
VRSEELREAYHPCFGSAEIGRGTKSSSGSPKSECFLGERKHSEALSFLSRAKKRLAELRADEVVGSSLAPYLQFDKGDAV